MSTPQSPTDRGHSFFLSRPWLRTLAALIVVTANLSLGICHVFPDNSGAKQTRPNIVLIVGDDWGYTDFGFMGSKNVHTPRLDRLAAESLVFRHGYVPSSLCRPSLATLYSGLYPHQHGITSNDPPKSETLGRKGADGAREFQRLREEQIAHIDRIATLPKLLGERGYRSFQTGKWWEGKYTRGGFTHGMTEGTRHGDAGLTIGRQSMQPIYDFVDESVKEGKPFFVWYAPFMPHTPHTPPERLLKKYEATAPTPSIAKYWAMCEWCDETCGQLLDFLDERKLAENTIVVYVTDNGWIQDPHGNNYAPKSKQSPFDTGLRTPITLRLPGKIKPRVSDDLAISIDLAPTLLKLCGISPTAEMQGIDLLDDAAVAARKQIFGEIFTHNAVDVHDPASSLRFRWTVAGDWKLILPNPANEPNSVVQLFNLANDEFETTNIAADHADVVTKLTATLDAWWKPKSQAFRKVSLQRGKKRQRAAQVAIGAKPQATEDAVTTKQAAADKPEAAKPNWIWAAAPAPQPDRERVWLRKEFKVERRFGSAKLYISGDDGLNVYIDGREVLSSDAWMTPTFKDVGKFLQSNEKPDGAGPHVIAVETRNDNGPGGIIVQLDVEYFNGTPLRVVTDATWQAIHGPAEGPWMKVGYDAKTWPAAKILAPLGGGPWGKQINEQTFTAVAKLRAPTATPVAELKIAKDFRAELLYTVPKDEEGSWVCLCMDPKGRLIVCDQHGGLYRLTLPPLDRTEAPQIEKIDVDIGEAQGLLWAFDSLYVSVNKASKYDHGLYRVRDTNGDDKLDTVEKLRALVGGGEHGPHAVVLAPDGKSLYVVIGNQTKLTELADSRVPLHWGEDHLLPRMPDGRGFMRGVLAPGGCIYRVNPDGTQWELIANGFRNEYDAAFNRAGELFTYDADMEWDMNTPWYRPTRVNHVVSGGEYGWRNGAGKWPAYYPDSVGAVMNVGPGSPTGVTFGYGAKFPAKYQEALFICDWSYGKMYALHLAPDGASYRGTLEEFISGSPLPLTDLVINPNDGAMYFAIGGRKTQSGLYRVTYVGGESTVATKLEPDVGTELRAVRRKLEALHRPDPAAVAAAWPYLGHEDRAIRYAARVALEHQHASEWQAQALAERNPRAAVQALLALVRVSANDPFHRKPGEAAPDAKLGAAILAAIGEVEWNKLPDVERIDPLRLLAVLFNRFGPPSAADREAVIARLDAAYPADDRRLNAELSNLLVYLEAPSAATKTVEMLTGAPTQEAQIEYARALRVLKTGWTPALRKTYFEWFLKAANYKGGSSFALFVQGIKNDAITTLTDDEKIALKEILEAKPESAPAFVAAPRPLVKEWKMDEVLAAVQSGLANRNFDRGRKMFAAANCFACHRFDNEGGAVGPDLSGLAGRFSVRDILESILEPSKVISDQYAAITVVTTDGRILTGRIINSRGDSFTLNTNMLDPGALETIDRKQIDEQFPAKASMMPTGLLNTLHEDEILDLLAYLVSRGDRNHPMFGKKAAGR
jgi:putative heme-binding domain-containing protein